MATQDKARWTGSTRAATGAKKHQELLGCNKMGLPHRVLREHLALGQLMMGTYASVVIVDAQVAVVVLDAEGDEAIVELHVPLIAAIKSVTEQCQHLESVNDNASFENL